MCKVGLGGGSLQYGLVVQPYSPFFTSGLADAKKSGHLLSVGRRYLPSQSFRQYETLV